jgi:hypothetical protein
MRNSPLFLIQDSAQLGTGDAELHGLLFRIKLNQAHLNLITKSKLVVLNIFDIVPGDEKLSDTMLTNVP